MDEWCEKSISILIVLYSSEAFMSLSVSIIQKKKNKEVEEAYSQQKVI
jgi:hypothetical protein